MIQGDNMRAIRQILTAEPVLEGAGVHLHRVFGYYQKPDFDPFLMLDDFRNDDPDKYLPGFPWHPHRGIETITYMHEGSAEHGDSLGNKGTIHAGEVQWMTAGSGIIHQEMPKPDASGRMYGFQLWTNLPASEKMCKPRYQDIKASDITINRSIPGLEVKVICGQFGDTKGPVEDIYANPQYWDVTLDANSSAELPAPMGTTCFIYIYKGIALLGTQKAGNRQLVLFEDGNGISLRAGEGGLSFLYLNGKPLNEPISWRGPIVMNTPEEIRQAFKDLETGDFIKSH